MQPLPSTIDTSVEPRTTIEELLGAARTGTARTQRSRKTRAALVSSVREELRETGSFTADAVAARSRCASATFYSHFATKDDALASAFELVLLELEDLVRETFTVTALTSLGLDTTIEDWIGRQVGFFRDESLVFRAALARLPFHRGIRHAYRETERITLAELTNALIHGQDAGLIRLGDPEELAIAFLVLSQGLNNPHVLRPDSQSTLDHLHRAMVGTLKPQEA